MDALPCTTDPIRKDAAAMESTTESFIIDFVMPEILITDSPSEEPTLISGMIYCSGHSNSAPKSYCNGL